MHEDLNLNTETSNTHCRSTITLAEGLPRAWGRAPYKSQLHIRNPTCLGGLTEELDGMDEESFNVRNPALEFMIS